MHLLSLPLQTMGKQGAAVRERTGSAIARRDFGDVILGHDGTVILGLLFWGSLGGEMLSISRNIPASRRGHSTSCLRQQGENFSNTPASWGAACATRSKTLGGVPQIKNPQGHGCAQKQ